ncbi:MAG: glycoside hydrolase family 31 protein [Candidatus Riflebacteria bacterium]|nr:glycoside hydrolase family 31 protein [Candidatus Riflebacteria bacterium]
MKLSIFAVFFVLFLCFPISSSGFDFAGKINKVEKTADFIELKLANCLLRIYPLEGDIVRFRYAKEKFSDAPSYAVLDKLPLVKFGYNESDTQIELTLDKLNISISKDPCRIKIFDTAGNLINSDDESFGVSFDGPEVRCFKKLYPDENFYGLGEKTMTLNRKSNEWVMWNSDVPAYSAKADPLYESIPFFMGVRKNNWYGIFLDNTYRSYFNLGAGNGRFYWFGAEKGELDYYFIGGPEVKKVISNYTKLTGKMPLPPLWALGFQQSKWSYPSEAKVRSVARTMREHDIPCDVLYLDIDYMDQYRVFTWGSEKFPNPAKMIEDLGKDGYKIVTIVDPGVKAGVASDGCVARGPKKGALANLKDEYPIAREGLEKDLFAKYPDGEYYIGEVWPSWAYFPDFTKSETRAWWADKISDFVKVGIQGVWNDMNEPAVWGKAFPDIVQFDDQGFGADHKKIHNVFGLLMARSTHEGLDKNSEKRHLVLTRAGYAGVQKYSAVWTGDNCATFEHLDLALNMLLSLGISGVPFVGSDVPGFAGIPTPELFVRWFQFGVFSPFFRAHSEINLPDKEPYAYGDSTERLVREAIKLRYKLLPFLYTEFYNCSQTGIPIMRPMFVEFPDVPEFHEVVGQKQFMIGENLLVAPVLSANDRFKKLFLPKGRWLEMDTKKVYEGPQWLIIDAPLEKIPLFIKEGGVIPMRDAQKYVGEKDFTQLDLLAFPKLTGTSNNYLYLDDGETKKYLNGEFSLLSFESRNNGNFEFEIKADPSKFKPTFKTVCLTIFGVEKPGKLLLNDKEVKPDQFKYSDSDKQLVLNVEYSDKMLLKVEK